MADSAVVRSSDWLELRLAAQTSKKDIENTPGLFRNPVTLVLGKHERD